MTLWPRSLQAQLVLRLAVVFVIATMIGVGGLFYEGVQTADAMRRDELLQRARELARHIVRNPDGTIAVALPAELDQVYRTPNAMEQFSVRSGNGRALAASQPEFVSATSDWPLGNVEPRYIRLKRFGPAGQEYCALTVGVDSSLGAISVTVGRAITGDALAHDILKEFVWDIAWAIPLFAVVMLSVGVWGIRSDLRPLRAVSEHAATIGPETTGVRLATGQLPTELTPLVVAINKALDRLERGLTLQREFTANAAHQLRTPLAILTAQIDEFPEGAQTDQLRSDVARMNRLVEQLLRVARLDTIPLAVDNIIDLRLIAAETVKYLAPWAIGQDRAIGFEAPDNPIWIRGNADAIADALRNLVENAVCYTRPKTEVSVNVATNGTVVIADRGPGVPSQDRARIFERFWRGRSTATTGAGLGLAIVAEIVRAHGGTIEVGDSPGGGAAFSLHLLTI